MGMFRDTREPRTIYGLPGTLVRPKLYIICRFHYFFLGLGGFVIILSKALCKNLQRKNLQRRGLGASHHVFGWFQEFCCLGLRAWRD